MFFQFFTESLRLKDLNKFCGSSRPAFDLKSKMLVQPRCNSLRLNILVSRTFFSDELCVHPWSFCIFQKSIFYSRGAQHRPHMKQDTKKGIKTFLWHLFQKSIIVVIEFYKPLLPFKLLLMLFFHFMQNSHNLILYHKTSFIK